MIKSNIDICAAMVQSASPVNRTLIVNVLGTDRSITDVFVVNDPGNYSFPEIGDVVLVLTTPTRVYAVGVIQYNYDKKIERKKVKDPTTKKYVRADPVEPGNINIGNIVHKTKIRIDKNGDFSFWSAALAGFKFEAAKKILSFTSNLFNLSAGTVTAVIGSVFRQVPGTGNTPFMALPPIDSTGTTGFSAVEAVFDLMYRQLRLVRLHLGHILTSVGVPEMSSVDVTKPLRAILETCFSGATICSIKMDEGGNIELNTTIGKVVIDSTVSLASILIGGLSASQSAVFGDLLKTWLDNHPHPFTGTITGIDSVTGAAVTGTCSGTTSAPSTPLPPTTLSQKVKIG